MSEMRHRRSGTARLVVHIVLFATLGVLLAGLGVTGNIMLCSEAEANINPLRVFTIHEGVQTLLKDVMKAVTTDVKDLKTIDNAFSAKRKSVKALLEDGITKNENAAVDAAIDIYLESVKNKLGESETGSRIEKALLAAREDIKKQLIADADAAVADVSVSSVRKSMSVTSTRFYVLKYYGQTLLILGVVLIVSAMILIILWIKRDEAGRAAIGLALEPLDYLFPFLLGIVVFTLYPIIRVFVMSLQEEFSPGKNGVGEFTRWGLGNYRYVLHGVPGTTNIFARALKNTAIYAIITVPLTAILAIIIAVLLNQKIRMISVFQIAYITPMVTTATAVGLVWRWMFNRDFGLINSILGFFGVNQINWLQSADYAISMTVLIVYGVWSTLPFTIILMLSGLQNIDENLYAAARVDGCGSLHLFTRITLPLLAPTVGLVLMINAITAFKVYTDVVMLWNGFPQYYGMETVTLYIYNNITTSDGTHSLGYAAAAAMVLLAIVFVFTLVQKWIQRKWVYR